MHTACKRNEMLDVIPFSWGLMNTGPRHEKVVIRTHWWYTNKIVSDMIYYGYWLLVMWSTMAIDYWWYDLLWLLITGDMIYYGYWLLVMWSTMAIDYWWYDLLWLLITSDMIYYGYWLPVIWSTVGIDYQWYDLLWVLITSDMIYCGYWLPVIWSTVGIQITISVQESSSVTVRPVSTAMGINHWARTSLSVIICWD